MRLFQADIIVSFPKTVQAQKVPRIWKMSLFLYFDIFLKTVLTMLKYFWQKINYEIPKKQASVYKNRWHTIHVMVVSCYLMYLFPLEKNHNYYKFWTPKYRLVLLIHGFRTYGFNPMLVRKASLYLLSMTQSIFQPCQEGDTGSLFVTSLCLRRPARGLSQFFTNLTV